jgi:hypothetical protein
MPPTEVAAPAHAPVTPTFTQAAMRFAVSFAALIGLSLLLADSETESLTACARCDTAKAPDIGHSVPVLEGTAGGPIFPGREAPLPCTGRFSLPKQTSCHKHPKANCGSV